jgi:hypothetical protein
MPRLTRASKDILIIVSLTVCVFVLSYLFNMFTFLVRFFSNNTKALAWIDEILMTLLTLSIGFAVFSWRRWREMREETEERLRAQKELIIAAEAKAETERIIAKQLHCDIEELKKIGRQVMASKREKER